MSEATIYKLAEVEKHTTVDDLWVVISGKVYDITKFVDEHPGGEEVLTGVAGQDATTEFEDVGHSDDAVDILEKYYVGDLDPSEISSTKSKGQTFTSSSPGSDIEGSSSMLYLIIAALIAGAAFVYLQALK